MVSGLIQALVETTDRNSAECLGFSLMRGRTEGRLQRLRYLRDSLGVTGMLRRLAGKLISPIYHNETAYITLVSFDEGELSNIETFADEHGTECVVVACPDELEDLAAEIRPPIQFSELLEHLKQGPNRSLILARRDDPDGPGKRIIGFKRMGRGRFGYFHGRLDGELPRDTLITQNDFVIPECRGQRVSAVMKAAAQAYAVKHGMRRLVGAIGIHNIASLRAAKNPNTPWKVTFLGPVKSVSVLGGLYTKTTPFSDVLSFLENPSDAQCDPPGTDA